LRRQLLTTKSANARLRQDHFRAIGARDALLACSSSSSDHDRQRCRKNDHYQAQDQENEQFNGSNIHKNLLWTMLCSRAGSCPGLQQLAIAYPPYPGLYPVRRS
jgi:hypothetical protein